MEIIFARNRPDAGVGNPGVVAIMRIVELSDAIDLSEKHGLGAVQANQLLAGALQMAYMAYADAGLLGKGESVGDFFTDIAAHKKNSPEGRKWTDSD